MFLAMDLSRYSLYSTYYKVRYNRLVNISLVNVAPSCSINLQYGSICVFLFHCLDMEFSQVSRVNIFGLMADQLAFCCHPL